MKRFIASVFLYGGLWAGIVICANLSACQKLGVSGHMAQLVGDWAQVRLPVGCIPKQIAAEEGGGTVVLCEDGRIFH